MNKRYVLSRRFLIFWTLFIGIGAVAGASAMLIDTSGRFMGMDALLPYFQVLPFAETLFQDFLFSGIALLIVNGLTNLTSATLLFMKKKSGIILGTIFGVTLMAWIVIQFVIFPPNFMSTIYFIFGFLQFLTGCLCLVGYEQRGFVFRKEDYKEIGKNGNRLVVFFSRCGYTKKLAYEIANESGAEIVEIIPEEPIHGDGGFWWCGRFGLKNIGMSILPLDIDFGKYEQVTLCFPIWVFKACAPVKEFCIRNEGKIRNVDYVITHFMGCKFTEVADRVDEMLSTKRNGFRSFRCRFGKLQEIK